MTLHGAVTLGGVVLFVGYLAAPAEAQRQREPAPEGSNEGRTAQSRPQADTDGGRTAQERSRSPSEAAGSGDQKAQDRPPTVKEPAQNSASVSNRREPDPPRAESQGRDRDRDRDDDEGRRGREKSSPSGAVVINPIVVGRPVNVGGVQVGSATVVGEPIVVGHPDAEPPRSRDERRYSGRESFGSGFTSTVFVDDQTELTSAGASPVDSVDEVIMPLRGDRESGARTSRISYYLFRPWYPVTARVMVGVPVLYPDEFANTYDKDSGTSRLEPAESVSALERGVPLVPYAPGTYGGISFDIRPSDTGVYVDGHFVGTVADYSPVSPPLPLAVGNHEVELRERGFLTESFVLFVSIGEVTPLSGSLERLEP